MAPSLRFAPLALACLFAAGGGGGCSIFNLQKPTATVRGMSVQDVNAQGFTMNFDVDLTNPNTVALPLGAADYKLGLGGVNVLNGKAKPEGTLPAGGSQSVRLPVTVTYENLLAAERAIREGGGDVPYDLDAALAFDTGTPLVGQLNVPLRYSGTLPVRQILSHPEALLQSPAAKKLALELLGHLFGR